MADAVTPSSTDASERGAVHGTQVALELYECMKRHWMMWKGSQEHL